MTRQDNRFSDAAVDRLRAAMQAGGAPVASATPCEEFDWNVPCRFTRQAQDALKDRARMAAESISGGLSRQLRMGVGLQLSQMSLRYARDLRPEQADSHPLCFRLTVGGEGDSCGWVAISPRSAVRWVGRLLGGAIGQSEDARSLSELETSLLLHIAGVLAEGLSSAFRSEGQAPFRIARGLANPAEVLTGPDWEDYCTFSFVQSQAQDDAVEHQPASPDAKAATPVEKSEAPDGSGEAADEQADPPAQQPATEQADPALVVVLSGPVAESCIGGAAQAADTRSAEDVRRDMTEHAKRVPVEAASVLGRAAVSMAEVIALEPGDVMLLGVSPTEPVQLTVQGQPVLAGVPVSCEGYYGLLVTEPPGAGAKAAQEQSMP